MMRFQDLQIRTKLVMIMVLTGMCVLLLAMVAMMATEYSRTRQAVTGELQTLAEVVGLNISAALVFDDETAARQTLAALGAKPSIIAAYLYTEQGEVFAHYGNSAAAAADSTSLTHGLAPEAVVARARGEMVVSEVRDGHQHVVHNVVFAGDHIGTLQIVDDQSELRRMIKGMYIISLLIVVVALGLIILISSRLQRIFSDPVHRLIEAMNEVARSKDYSTPLAKTSHDEFGVLVEVYNKMLLEIEERDGQLADHGKRLEKQVSERTMQLSKAVRELEISSREAVEAKNSAEAASRAKSEFLATMSHEIRTPMNGVLGMAELLTASQLSPRQARFAKTIQTSGNALLEVINEILDFSKIESGMLTIDPHGFHLGELLEDISELMYEQASQKGLEISLDIPTEARVTLRGDALRIRQVMVNLVGNAIKFTSEGRVQVRVLPEKGRDNHLAFTCEVTDTGIGIAPDGLAEIFDAFTQADGSTTRRFGGTGLGLAISRQLIDLMDGEMGVRSVSGEGSTFWIRLELPCEATESDQQALHYGDLAGCNVLLVDDTQLNLEILREFATSWGMGSAGVMDAEEALKALNDGTASGKAWDAVLLDLHLPGRNGIELAADIRQLAGCDDIPMIMLSSTHNDSDVAQAQRVGINRYLQKPVRKAVLGEALAKLVRDGVTGPEAERKIATEQREAMFTGRVLVAEDNPVNQEVAGGMLELLGLEVDFADNGHQVLSLAQEQHYDLILMDCHMPDMDGFAATSALRRLERRGRNDSSGKVSRRPIIAVTANVQKEVQTQCFTAGMDGYLSKPFTWDQIIAILERWLPEHCVLGGDEPVLVEASSHSTREAEAPVELPILDPSVLLGLQVLQRPGRPDIVQTAIEKYFINFAEKCRNIEQALADGDAALLTEAAHFMKSSSASLGALALSELCRILEGIGRTGKIENAQGHAADFARVSQATRTELESRVGAQTNVAI